MKKNRKMATNTCCQPSSSASGPSSHLAVDHSEAASRQHGGPVSPLRATAIVLAANTRRPHTPHQRLFLELANPFSARALMPGPSWSILAEFHNLHTLSGRSKRPFTFTSWSEAAREIENAAAVLCARRESSIRTAYYQLTLELQLK